MIDYVSDCVDCGRHCLYGGCPHYSVRVMTCDVCEDEVDVLYDDDGAEVCASCLADAHQTEDEEYGDCAECGDVEVELFRDGDVLVCQDCLEQRHTLLVED